MFDRFKKVALASSSISIYIITFFTFFSRFLGFIRQYLIFQKLDKLESDLFLSANKLPEYISIFLLMGTIYSSVLPIASRLEKKFGNDKISSYLNWVTFFIGFTVLVLVLLGVLFTKPLLELVSSPDFLADIKSSGLMDEYILTTRIFFIVPINFSIQAILGVFLTIKKRFLTYSLTGLLVNVGSIIGLLISTGDVVTITWFTVLGGVSASFLFLIDSIFQGYKVWQSHWSLSSIYKNFLELKPDLINTLKVFWPRIFLIDGFYTASFLITRIQQDSGQITALDIGTSIQGAFFVVVTSLGVVFFPKLSETLQNQSLDSNVFWDQLFKYLKVSVVLGIAVTIATLIGTPLIMYLYELAGQGQGTGDYIVKIAWLASISLVFRSVHEILSKYFYAVESQWRPLILSLISLTAQVIFTLIFVDVLNIDAGYATALGLVVYNLFWVVVGYYYLLQDKRLATVS